MKKNNKGFFLLETIIVSTFIITVLLYLYIQFSNIKKSYDISFKYDTIGSLYSLKEVDKFINEKFGYSDLKNNVDNEENKYIELYDKNKCNVLNIPGEYSYCEKLMENLNIKTLLFVSSDISYLKYKLKTNNPYSNNLFLYLKTIDSNVASNGYVLIAEFNNNTFATLKIDKKPIKCIRAKNLHTEICNRDDSNGCRASGYAKNDKITYGNLGKVGVLNVGDAFDCDVNGDGNYNYKSERFYYVSDYFDTETKEFNDGYAVLMYYTNVDNGKQNNNSTFAYNIENKNNFGPISLLNNFSSSNSWKNVHLIKDERQLLTDDNLLATADGELSKYTYYNKSSRLITYKEVFTGCYDDSINMSSNGSLDQNCLFMLENTRFSDNESRTYGSWLETPSSNHLVWSFESNTRRIANESYSNNSTNYGVRPVIEVNKEDIEF